MCITHEYVCTLRIRVYNNNDNGNDNNKTTTDLEDRWPAARL